MRRPSVPAVSPRERPAEAALGSGRPSSSGGELRGPHVMELEQAPLTGAFRDGDKEAQFLKEASSSRWAIGGAQGAGGAPRAALGIGGRVPSFCRPQRACACA